jgi:VWFA-related protein
MAGVAAAQEPADRFLGEATVNVIEVPVQVLDPTTGEPVKGLQRRDFRIVENGREQDISNFAEVTRPPSAGDASVRTADGGTLTSQAERPLQMVYFIDLYLMYRSERERALAALEERYRQGIPLDESVSLVVFDGALEIFVDRTDDSDELREALEDVRFVTARGPQQTIAFSQELSDGPVTGERDAAFYERRHRSREYMAELEKKIGRVGDAIGATMARYGRADGRRVLVAFTPGYPRITWAPSYAPVDFVNAAVEYPDRDLWQEVAHRAADLGFTFFAVDSSGVPAPGDVSDQLVAEIQPLAGSAAGGAGQQSGDGFAIGAGDAGDMPASMDPNAPSELGSWIERTRKDLLISASRATGGDALFATELEGALLTVDSSLSHYYSLAYTADHMGDGETYSIEVTLPDHPSYRVIHRTAYIDQPAATRAAQRLRSQMLFGGEANPLAVRVELGEADTRFRLGAAGSKRVTIPLELKIPFARMEMVERGTVYWGKLQITFFNQDAAGNQSQLATFAQPVTVASDRYREAVAKGYFSFQTTIEVEGGQQDVYVGVEDVLGGRTSILPQPLRY